jgi:hypothetical protein
MTLGGLLVLLIIAGVVLAMFPLDPTVRKLILVVIIILTLVAVLRLAGAI